MTYTNRGCHRKGKEQFRLAGGAGPMQHDREIDMCSHYYCEFQSRFSQPVTRWQRPLLAVC